MIKFPNGLKAHATFGKYRFRKTWEEIIMEDPKYVEWCFQNLEHFDLEDDAKELWRTRMLAIEGEESEG